MDTIIQIDPNNTSVEVIPIEIPVTIIEILEENGKRYQKDNDTGKWIELEQ